MKLSRFKWVGDLVWVGNDQLRSGSVTIPIQILLIALKVELVSVTTHYSHKIALLILHLAYRNVTRLFTTACKYVGKM